MNPTGIVVPVAAACAYIGYRLFLRYRPNLRREWTYYREKIQAWLTGRKSGLSLLWFSTTANQYRDGMPLHHASAWKYMTNEQWRSFVQNSIAYMEPPIGPQDNVFEVGCGVGAFSKTIEELTGCTDFAGIDPVPEAISLAQKVFPSKRFLVGNGLDLSDFADNGFDHVLAAGVIMYLDSLDEAGRFVSEMLRIAKPGASLMINCVSEPGGRNLGSGNIYIPKEWWMRAVGGHVITSFREMGEWPGCEKQRGRYSVYLRKSNIADNGCGQGRGN